MRIPLPVSWLKKRDPGLSQSVQDAVQIAGQVQEGTDPCQRDQKSSCQRFLEKQFAKLLSVAEKEPHTENPDGQTELQGIFDGQRDSSLITAGLFFRDCGKQHGRYRGGQRIGKHEKRHGHSGKNPVETQGIRSTEPGLAQAERNQGGFQTLKQSKRQAVSGERQSHGKKSPAFFQILGDRMQVGTSRRDKREHQQ